MEKEMGERGGRQKEQIPTMEQTGYSVVETGEIAFGMEIVSLFSERDSERVNTQDFCRPSVCADRALDNVRM